MTLKIGSRGIGVEDVQRALGIKVDGAFWTETDAAVRKFQLAHGLVADGCVGPATRKVMFTKSRSLQPRDLEQAAGILGVELAAVKAIVAVESRGHGFFENGLPVILFERHIMHRRLGAIGRDADELEKFLPTIINRSPGGYLVGRAEHSRLYTARQVHPDIAIESASWGLFQIMGFHWKSLGYKSAEDFEQQMTASEREQLDAFVRFILKNPPIYLALKAHDWESFAHGYNGPAYAKNQYDVKLAAAYARHKEV